MEHDIQVAQAEIDLYVEMMERRKAEQGLSAENGLPSEEVAEAMQMRRDFAEAIIRNWKINKTLHAEYGGRIIYQQLGLEPLDAYRMFLEQRQSEGAPHTRGAYYADQRATRDRALLEVGMPAARRETRRS